MFQNLLIQNLIMEFCPSKFDMQLAFYIQRQPENLLEVVRSVSEIVIDIILPRSLNYVIRIGIILETYHIELFEIM